MRLSRLSTVPASFLLAAAPVAQEASFQGLGDLPGGRVSSGADAVSADGRVVVGSSASEASGANTEAFRWTAATGMVGLGDLPGGRFDSNAYWVSADGAVVVGSGRVPGETVTNGAFVWTAAAGMTALPGLPGGGETSFNATAVTPDGSVVVGTSYGDEHIEAVRWVGGLPHGLGVPPGGSASLANAVSADGSVVVGHYRVAGTNEAVAFRWTEGGGMEPLPEVPGGSFYHEAYDVSADGAVVVGVAGTDAFVWTAEGGSRRVRDVLEGEHGLDLGGWQIRSARGVSADGTVIVGGGDNPSGASEGWRAVLPRAVASGPGPGAPALSVSVWPNPGS